MKRFENGQITQATMKQVAQEAQVSVQTVSRVINKSPKVSPDTLKRVEEAISRLEYRPNIIARNLSQRRTKAIGIVASNLGHYGPAQTLIGIDQTANQMGYSFHLSLLHQSDSQDVEQMINNLLSQQVEGVIWAAPGISNNGSWLQKAAHQIDIPIVFLDTQPDPSLKVVSIDNRIGARLATEHLIAQKYQKIGLVTGPSNWWSARERRNGWQDAHIFAGIPFSDTQIVEGDWTAKSGEQALYDLLKKSPGLQAVFVSNDQMALGLLRAARLLGLKVPQDLAVVGFDDLPESAYFYPSLTTVQQDLYGLGRTAVHTLIRMIDDQYAGVSAPSTNALFLQPQLVVRESSVVSS